MFWMSCVITILQLLVDIDSSSDDRNSLLASSLFIFRDRACNDEKLRMRCPRGTAISVRWAQYGRPSPSECPPVKRLRKEQQTRAATTTTMKMHFDHRPSNESTSSLDCVAPSSLQVVMNLCEDHSQCSVTVSPQLFGFDLCPGAEKILTVGYQCPPKELITRTAPRGSSLEVRCSMSKRIALHSVFYGYSPCFNVTECTSQSASDAVCSSSCPAQTVGRLCFGRRSCNLQVDASVFGNPCQSEINEYLVVVFACVEVRTLKEIRDSTFPYSKCENAVAALTTVTAFMHSDPLDHLNATSVLTSASVLNTSSMPKINVKSYLEEFLDDVLWTFLFIKENLEKFCLYLILALCAGVLLVLLVIIVRLFVALFHYRYCIRQLKLIERSPAEKTRGRSEDETVVERSLHPSPERPRRGEGGGGHHRHMTSSPGSPAFAHIWDSPVFVHVESPHESPVLGHHLAESPLESPVWVRAPSAAASPSPVPTSAESLAWQLPEHLTPVLQLPPSVPCSPVPQTVDGSRPLGEAQSPSTFYTNPFRHDPYRTERRSHSVRPYRLPFDR